MISDTSPDPAPPDATADGTPQAAPPRSASDGATAPHIAAKSASGAPDGTPANAPESSVTLRELDATASAGCALLVKMEDAAALAAFDAAPGDERR